MKMLNNNNSNNIEINTLGLDYLISTIALNVEQEVTEINQISPEKKSFRVWKNSFPFEETQYFLGHKVVKIMPDKLGIIIDNTIIEVASL